MVMAEVEIYPGDRVFVAPRNKGEAWPHHAGRECQASRLSLAAGTIRRGGHCHFQPLRKKTAKPLVSSAPSRGQIGRCNTRSNPRLAPALARGGIDLAAEARDQCELMQRLQIATC